ncbi:2'-5' RNA ligase family protein [Mucilaginibacter ginsenosidivorans]|uniref:2'-5' RNA ligase family protein n=1 Tax=Mucilaginibacter ginsenosidivorans TaxID=398053 RepID=A0A5B8UZ33_9SPHI|nr:2'-5' RNA ligase family protein [Mucilaginibacter ginsenosidivorans]QEC64467.1 2'-5' RNA ligase family protein [Mucilaginibacter ginsenosidivorans]
METYKDYMIILTPPIHIAEQVKKYKHAAQRLIGDFESMHSKAHISLKRLHRQKPYWTEPLFDKLEKELSLLEPVTLQLNGFATFLPTDFTTIYAAILSTPEMEDWFKRLRQCLGEKKAVPHITIARQVPNDKARKLWPKFKDRPWNEEFEVKYLTILHRSTYEHDRTWEIFRQIPFKGKPEWNVLPEKRKEIVKPVDENQTSLF